MWLFKVVFACFLVNFVQCFNGFEMLLVKNFVQNKLAQFENVLNDNSSCGRDLISTVRALERKEVWAIKMLDSWSKLEAGVLEGNILNLGSYDECLGIQGQIPNTTQTIHGKYCLMGIDIWDVIASQLKDIDKYKTFVELATNAMTNGKRAEAAFAVCVPDTCQIKHLDRIYNKTAPPGTNVKVFGIDDTCQTNNDNLVLDTIDWLAILTICGTAGLMICSTTYDGYLRLTKHKALHKILISYSVLTNLKHLTDVKRSSEQISCINGIRTISMMWVILGHRLILFGVFPKLNYVDLLDWMHKVSSGYVLGASVSVDTFLLLSGILVIYVVLIAKQHGFNVNLVYFYVHRYVRLTPALAVLVLLYMGPLRVLSKGPAWPLYDRYIHVNCKQDWWKALLYIQNTGNHKICVSHSWYLAVDTQLYVLAPVFFLTMPRWPRIVLPFMGFLIAASSYWAFYLAWIKEIKPDIVTLSSYHMHDLYAFTPIRASVWLIGALFGYALFTTREKKIRIHKALNLILWILCVTSMAFVVYFQTYFWRNPYDRVISSLFIGLARNIWALSVGYIIFACYHGYGGAVNRFLSCSIFIVLGRLTYSMYLVHLLVMAVIFGGGRVTIYFSNFNMIHGYWGDFFCVVLVALVWTLAFESPVIAIGKLFLPQAMKAKVKEMHESRNEAHVNVEPIRASDA